MKIIIIGGVAAGTSAAAKASRNDPSAQITLYEKDHYISYSGCGMPYFIGDLLTDSHKLNPRDPAWFKTKYNVEVKTTQEVLRILPVGHKVIVRNLTSGETFQESYDKLIIATGARAFLPPIKGSDGDQVFSLRNFGDMLRIKAFIATNQPKSAVIIGSGSIGMEVCENLVRLGLAVTVIEKLPQVVPVIDSALASLVESHLKSKGVRVITGADVSEITREAVLLKSGERISCDLALISTGIRPESALAEKAGAALGVSGSIQVDATLKTSLPDIYACGDCAENFHVVTGKPVYRPLGTTANKMGRIAGDAVTGGTLEYKGTLGTGIFKVFDLAVGMTGLSEKEALDEGYPVTVIRHDNYSKPDYFDGKKLSIKAVVDQSNGKLLGAQVVGEDGADKRLDVYATAITLNGKASDLSQLDLAYSPPFSTTRDPVLYTGMIFESLEAD